MKENIGKRVKLLTLGVLSFLSVGVYTSCIDDIPEGNRFTFTGELIADHLKNDTAYSNFCWILEKATTGRNGRGSSMLTTLSTYGAYTCFAPTNEAINSFLVEKYNEWKESVEQHEQDNDVKIINTGIYSTDLKELSDSMASVIAKNHIIEMRCLISGAEVLPQKTMNRQSVQISWGYDSLENIPVPYAEGIKLLQWNTETENGYVHRLESVISPTDQPTSTLLSTQPAFTLFSEALEKTGLGAKLEQLELDPNYDGLGKYGTPFKTQNNQEPPYPETYYAGFTLLVETDDLLADSTKNHLKLSIQSIEQLEFFAAHWYGSNLKVEKFADDTYDIAKSTFDYKGNYTNQNNPLYKFVAYHIIDRALKHSSGRGSGGFVMENYFTPGDDGPDKNKFNSEINLPDTFDRYDYFETELPYTLIKVTKPLANHSGMYKQYNGSENRLRDEIVLNYAQEMGTRCKNENMKHHINVVVEKYENTITRPGLEEFKNQATNGWIYTIDKILIYNDDEMATNILQERMRWDVFSLFPELTNNDVRWKLEDAKYTMVYIPENYCKRLRHRNTDTNIYYLRPHVGNWAGGYANYQGDEMLVTGKYDFEYRIPFVPEGRYEIRFGFSTSDSRGVAQFYFDDKICGIPLDMRISNADFMGWFEESDNESENRKNDKSMRNRGFMKAPASIALPGDGGPKNMRYTSTALRRVIGTYDLNYNSSNPKDNEYWLRFKDVTEGGSETKPNEFNQDYLEIIPIKIITDPAKPEDIY